MTTIGLHRDPDGVLVVTGMVDLMTAPLLRQALNGGPPQSGREQVLDLRQVTYLDSYGLTVLFEQADSLRVLITSGSALSTVARMSGLTQALAVEFLPTT